MRARLLVAESEPALAEVYCRFFASHGYDVASADDSRECLHKLHEMDVLILDLEFPRGGRERVVTRLRHDPLAPAIPVVLLANANSREWLASLVVPPVVDCLQKPFRLASLLEVVRALVAMDHQPA